MVFLSNLRRKLLNAVALRLAIPGRIVSDYLALELFLLLAMRNSLGSYTASSRVP